MLGSMGRKAEYEENDFIFVEFLFACFVFTKILY